MTLIEDWDALVLKLWSVRLALIAAILSGIETYFQYHTTGSAPLITCAATVVSLLAAFARIVAQPAAIASVAPAPPADAPPPTPVSDS
jgi:hypothetical protein